MIRFLSHLFGKPYETCKSCETLKGQLTLVNSQNRELTETLLKLVKPEVIHQPAPTIITPAVAGATFAQRRAALEQAHKNTETIKKNSTFIARPDGFKLNPNRPVMEQSIEEIERKLQIEEEVKNG